MAVPLPEKESKNNSNSGESGSDSIGSGSERTEQPQYPTSIPTIIGNVPISKEEAERLYEERIEDEYAKREGGA